MALLGSLDVEADTASESGMPPLGVANAHGFSSSIHGGLAILFALSSRALEPLQRPHGGYVLDLARRFGVLREGGETPEISATTWLTITDAWVVAALSVLGAYLAVLALICALWAEHREEDSLYSSVGFLCAGLTLFVLHQVVGASVAFAGTVAILAIRRRSESRRGGH